MRSNAGRLLLVTLLGLSACSLLVEADTDRLGGDPGSGGDCDENPGCDDAIDCTNDFCNAGTGDCEHEPRDERCGGQRCVPGQGCEAPRDCTDDVDCDDGTGCNEASCVDDRCEVRPIDADGDEFPRCGGDCDDGAGAVNPDEEEVCGDGLDNDCNGVIDDVGDPCDCT